MFPSSGGVYEFSKQAYGRFFSFIIGWITFLAGNFTIAMLVVGAIQYLLPIPLVWPKIAISLLFIFIFNYIAYKGMKTSSVMLVTFAIITSGTLVALIIPNFINFNVSNIQPFLVTPMSKVFVAIFFIAETFFGWETATFLAGETKDGAKTMPKALVYGTIVIAIISLLFVISSLGASNWEIFGNSEAPLAMLGGLHYGNLGQNIFTILVYLSIIGSVAGWIVSAPRLVLSMAKDKLFPKQFAKVHPKYFTPYRAIILQVVITTLFVIVGSGSYEVLLEMLLPFLLLMYSVVLIALVILRYKKPNLKRYYKAPFGKIGPFIVILFLIFLITMWVKNSSHAFQLLRLGLSFILFGIPLYLLVEVYYDKNFIRKTNDFFAFFTLITENIHLPKKIRKEIMLTLGNIHKKKVLEFGCGVGTLTLWLLEDVGKKGYIFATDLSKHNVNILDKRVKKRNIKHIKIIHDLNHSTRVHPDVPKVDATVSVNELSNLQNPCKVLKEINQRLKKGSKAIFIDYDKFFRIIPNREWLNNDYDIIKMFKRAGFKIKVKRKKGFFWEYVFIEGEKV